MKSNNEKNSLEPADDKEAYNLENADKLEEPQKDYKLQEVQKDAQEKADEGPFISLQDLMGKWAPQCGQASAPLSVEQKGVQINSFRRV